MIVGSDKYSDCVGFCEGLELKLSKNTDNLPVKSDMVNVVEYFKVRNVTDYEGPIWRGLANAGRRFTVLYAMVVWRRGRLQVVTRLDAKSRVGNSPGTADNTL